MAQISSGAMVLQNRRLVDITYRYPELTRDMSNESD